VCVDDVYLYIIGVNSITLDFRVKFYASEPANLLEELTRYLFFRQVKKDLAENKLPCQSEAAAILSAFSLQAELGDHDPVGHPPGYVSEFRFISNQVRFIFPSIGIINS
jgi:hypothetical protein